MATIRHIHIELTIEHGDYFADDAAADEWARRLMSRICDLKMSTVINTMNHIITP